MWMVERADRWSGTERESGGRGGEEQRHRKAETERGLQQCLVNPYFCLLLGEKRKTAGGLEVSLS